MRLFLLGQGASMTSQGWGARGARVDGSFRLRQPARPVTERAPVAMKRFIMCVSFRRELGKLTDPDVPVQVFSRKSEVGSRKSEVGSQKSSEVHSVG
jgi:hypothetical protein